MPASTAREVQRHAGAMSRPRHGARGTSDARLHEPIDTACASDSRIVIVDGDAEVGMVDSRETGLGLRAFDGIMPSVGGRARATPRGGRPQAAPPLRREPSHSTKASAFGFDASRLGTTTK